MSHSGSQHRSLPAFARGTVALLAPCLVLSLALAGCATPPPASDPDAVADFKATNDPLEPTNRFIYKVNDTADKYAFKPLAQGYVAVVPHPVRDSVHNFLLNMSAPTMLVSDIAQANPNRAATTIWRFTVNSLLGVGGLFDVAAWVGVKANSNDFNTTLGVWGVSEGPYLVLPFFGPSSVRGAVGLGVDSAADPYGWAPTGYGIHTLNYTSFVATAIDTRSRYLTDLDRVKAQALDPYATIRSLYRQNSQAAIDKAKTDAKSHYLPSNPAN